MYALIHVRLSLKTACHACLRNRVSVGCFHFSIGKSAPDCRLCDHPYGRQSDFLSPRKQCDDSSILYSGDGQSAHAEQSAGSQILNGIVAKHEHGFNADADSVDNGLPRAKTPLFAVIKRFLRGFQLGEAVISPDQIVSIVVMG